MRRVRVGLIAVMAVVTALAVPPARASAASGLTWSTNRAGNYVFVLLYYNGHYAGEATWSENPDNYDYNLDGRDDPGDAVIAYDGAADGYGVETRLSTGRFRGGRRRPPRHPVQVPSGSSVPGAVKPHPARGQESPSRSGPRSARGGG